MNGNFITSQRPPVQYLAVEPVAIDVQGKFYAASRGSGRMGVKVCAPRLR